uniref:BTB domain-containing protein n=1 Tax=Panagrolaimus sp. ES5 TaxID=591445 RepID=A0AC34GPR8_9BILA
MSETDFKVHIVWSINKKMFMKRKYFYKSEKYETTFPNAPYYFTFDPNTSSVPPNGYGGAEQGAEICFIESRKTTSIEEMKLLVPSANFQIDFPTDEWNPNVYIKHEDIYNPDMNFFVDGILTLEIRGTLRFCIPIFNLGKFLWEKKDGKDFTFIVEKEKIKAHKFIIGQFSSIFAAVINSAKNEMKIENFDKNVVEAVIEACYDIRSLINYPAKYYLKLIKFTNTFDMPVIKAQIEQKMKEMITTDNVLEIAKESVELDAEILHGFCLTFISNTLKSEDVALIYKHQTRNS